MVSGIARVIISAALISVTGAAAFAADLPTKAPILTPAVAPVSNVYVVVGGSVLLPGSTKVTDRDCAGANSLIPCAADNKIDGDVGWLVGGAVGYRFTPWLRADVSLGYGQDTASGTRAPVPPEVNTPSYHAKFTSFGGFVTGYIDFAGFLAPGQLGGFEPFIGAGIGASRVRINELTFSNTGFPGVQFNLPELETTKAAFKFTVGTGYRFDRHWALEVAYTYYDLGHVDTPAGTVTTTPAGAFPPFQTNGFDVRLRSHAVELGLRYDF